MPQEVKSLFNFEPDPEDNRAQQRIVNEIYAEYGLNYGKMKNDLKHGHMESVDKEALGNAEAHKWVLENAAIRGRKQGFTVFGLLRMMIEFRSMIAARKK